VVAALGATLRYRVDGRWRPASGDAALVPDGATEVEVSRAGAGSTVLPLT
jgi:hypothetical protein